MVKGADERINLRFPSDLKDSLKSKVEELGFDGITDYFRACAELAVYESYTGTKGTLPAVISDQLQDNQSPVYDNEIRMLFFGMMSSKFSAVVARFTSPRKLYELHEDVAVAFLAETGITLLPQEVMALVNQYYSNGTCKEDMRRAREEYLRHTYGMDYQTKICDTPKHPTR